MPKNVEVLQMLICIDFARVDTLLNFWLSTINIQLTSRFIMLPGIKVLRNAQRFEGTKGKGGKGRVATDDSWKHFADFQSYFYKHFQWTALTKNAVQKTDNAMHMQACEWIHTLTCTHIRTQLLTRKTALEINKSFDGLGRTKLKLIHSHAPFYPLHGQ